MRTLATTLLLLAPLLLVAPTTDGASCPTTPTAAPGPLYVLAGIQGGHNHVQVLGYSVSEQIVSWQRGLHEETWLETNGVDGLQRVASECGPADTLLTRTYTGLGGASIGG